MLPASTTDTNITHGCSVSFTTLTLTRCQQNPTLLLAGHDMTISMICKPTATGSGWTQARCCTICNRQQVYHLLHSRVSPLSFRDFTLICVHYPSVSRCIVILWTPVRLLNIKKTVCRQVIRKRRLRSRLYNHEFSRILNASSLIHARTCFGCKEILLNKKCVYKL